MKYAEDSRNEKIDIIRGVSCILIYLMHLYSEKNLPILDYKFIKNSSVFVDIFFLLSGYILYEKYYSRINNKNEYLLFLRKRINRIYPLLLYAALVFLIFSLISECYLSNYKSINHTSKEYLFSLINSLFLFSATDLGLISKYNFINSVSWTVSVEVLLYILYGYIFTFKKNIKLILIIVLLTSLLLIIGQKNSSIARGLFSFSIGIFTNIFKIKYRDKFEFFKKLFILLYIIIFLFLYYYSDLLIKNNLRYILIPLSFCPILLNGFKIEFNTRIAIILKSLFKKIGQLSYSIYLNHTIVIIIALKSIIIFRINILNFTSQFIFLLITTIVLLYYSLITYKYIEKIKIFRN